LKTNKFDIIIAGAGLSGLSLAFYLIKGGYSGQVLIVDKSFAPSNTKTWCFWEKELQDFHPIVKRSWKKGYFSSLDYQTFLYMHDYTYYCVRENEYKEFILRKIRQASNFTLLEEPVLDFSSNKKKAVLLTKSSDTYLADYIFQSLILPEAVNPENIKYPLIQHFLGWEIRTNRPVFDSETITFMDFDNEAEKPAFMYMLPAASDKSLVEYTVFSEDVFEDKSQYEQKIIHYLSKRFNLQDGDYVIERTEYGEIPMQHRPYKPMYASKVYNLGTVGGLTKPSTGYTFSRIHEHSRKLARSLCEGREPVPAPQSEFRYRYYDRLLLHILSNSTADSLNVFKYLFRNNTIDQIFGFLSETSSFTEDLRIMSSVPYLPFFRAIARNLNK